MSDNMRPIILAGALVGFVVLVLLAIVIPRGG